MGELIELVGKVICAECKKMDWKSRVYSEGGSRTLMATIEYWDEDGNYHYSDPNTTSIQYRCTNGHSWSKIV